MLEDLGLTDGLPRSQQPSGTSSRFDFAYTNGTAAEEGLQKDSGTFLARFDAARGLLGCEKNICRCCQWLGKFGFAHSYALACRNVPVGG
jgi:hypothetical protein